MSNGKEMSLVCHRIITLKFVFVFLFYIYRATIWSEENT